MPAARKKKKMKKKKMLVMQNVELKLADGEGGPKESSSRREKEKKKGMMTSEARWDFRTCWNGHVRRSSRRRPGRRPFGERRPTGALCSHALYPTSLVPPAKERVRFCRPIIII